MSSPEMLVIVFGGTGAFVGKLVGETSDEVRVTGLCHMENTESGDWFLVPAAIPLGLFEDGLGDVETVFQKGSMGSMTLLPYKRELGLGKIFSEKWAPVTVMDNPAEA